MKLKVIHNSDRMMYLRYHQSDIAVITFAVNNESSFQNITEKWHPEGNKHFNSMMNSLVSHYCGQIPIVLCATKKDLRDNLQELENLRKYRKTTITYEEV